MFLIKSLDDLLKVSGATLEGTVPRVAQLEADEQDVSCSSVIIITIIIIIIVIIIIIISGGKLLLVAFLGLLRRCLFLRRILVAFISKLPTATACLHWPSLLNVSVYLLPTLVSAVVIGCCWLPSFICITEYLHNNYYSTVGIHLAFITNIHYGKLILVGRAIICTCGTVEFLWRWGERECCLPDFLSG